MICTKRFIINKSTILMSHLIWLKVKYISFSLSISSVWKGNCNVEVQITKENCLKDCILRHSITWFSWKIYILKQKSMLLFKFVCICLKAKSRTHMKQISRSLINVNEKDQQNPLFNYQDSYNNWSEQICHSTRKHHFPAPLEQLRWLKGFRKPLLCYIKKTKIFQRLTFTPMAQNPKQLKPRLCICDTNTW